MKLRRMQPVLSAGLMLCLNTLKLNDHVHNSAQLSLSEKWLNAAFDD